jgi:DNA-binding response OmpR family regulator
VLFVEDDDYVRELFAGALREAGIAVTEATLAEHVLDVLKVEMPQLIILDLGMPPGEMSGTELLARLRENPTWAAVDLIVFSGMGDVLNPDVVRGLRVHTVFTKPTVTAQELVRTVRAVLQKHGGA